MALAPQRRGSVDVVELDAASYGGVDDTRELARPGVLRACAIAATASSSSMRRTWSPRPGFNALLKIVEEPPEHLIFVFRDHRTGEGAADHPVAHAPPPVRLLAPRTCKRG